MIIGVLFFVVGIAVTTVFVHQWSQDPVKWPIAMVGFPLIFVGLGLMFSVVCVRDWWRKVDTLRRGYLTRCRIVQCKGKDDSRWKDFDKAFNEMYRAWHAPLATPSQMKWSRMVGWGALVLNGLIAIGFVLVAGILIWVFRGEGWLVLAPIGMLLFAWFFFRFTFRFLKRFISLSPRPLQWGIKPVVEVRIEFHLPNGKLQRAEAKIDWQRQLNAGAADPNAIAVYHPVNPQHASLLGSFRPQLEVGDSGQWQFAAPNSTSDVKESGLKAYITPSGQSYHRRDCRFVGDHGSPVPIEYAQRYYEPCDVCQPPEVGASTAI